MKLLQNVLLVVVLAFFSSNLCAQNIQWASKIISFSSEYTDPLLSKEYKAIHILGRPSKYPKFQNSPSAWQSLTPDNPAGEYIIVGFDTTQFVKQVAIFENFGAGSFSRIDALDDNNKLYVLKEFPEGYAKANGQVTYVQLPNQTNYHDRGIKKSMNYIKQFFGI